MTVFDSSALLAYLFDEPGAGAGERLLDEDGWCGAANWAEVAQKSRARGLGWPTARALLQTLGLDVEPVDSIDAERAAELCGAVPGLSLAARLCLALGERLGESIVTADRAWEGLPDVVVIR